jgi:hypothetical protein
MTLKAILKTARYRIVTATVSPGTQMHLRISRNADAPAHKKEPVAHAHQRQDQGIDHLGQPRRATHLSARPDRHRWCRAQRVRVRTTATALGTSWPPCAATGGTDIRVPFARRRESPGSRAHLDSEASRPFPAQVLPATRPRERWAAAHLMDDCQGLSSPARTPAVWPNAVTRERIHAKPESEVTILLASASMLSTSPGLIVRP